MLLNNVHAMFHAVPIIFINSAQQECQKKVRNRKRFGGNNERTSKLPMAG